MSLYIDLVSCRRSDSAMDSSTASATIKSFGSVFIPATAPLSSNMASGSSAPSPLYRLRVIRSSSKCTSILGTIPAKVSLRNAAQSTSSTTAAEVSAFGFCCCCC